MARLGIDPVAARGQEAAAAGAQPLDPGTLRTLFLDLLGRPPFEAERLEWSQRDSTELIDACLGGQEFWENWLEEQLYYFLLIDNFRPMNEGVLSLPAELAAGSLGVRGCLHRICLSSSFDRRNPGPDTFVSVVMEQLLGLTVQKIPRELEIGKKLYDGRAGTFLGQNGSSQADVVRIAIEDERALRHLLLREHQRLLRCDPSERQLGSWTKSLAADERALVPIYREWLLSGAHARRRAQRAPEPNRLFVRALFVDLLGRLPTEQEAQRLRGALDGLADSGPLRSVVARLVLDSGQAALPERGAIPDPAQWIQGLFSRLLGRAAAPQELAVFLEVFADPACRPETVLYAIVSHPDYQTW
jgi:hypothetical protein